MDYPGQVRQQGCNLRAEKHLRKPKICAVNHTASRGAAVSYASGVNSSSTITQMTSSMNH